MSPSPDPLGWLAGQAHPRLAVLVIVGAGAGLVGAALALAGGGLGTAGFRLGVLGLLAFLLGASGYVAFAVFERGFD